MLRLLCGLILVLAIATPSLGQQSLVGTYKLVSFTEEIGDTRLENMGKAPNGYSCLRQPGLLLSILRKTENPAPLWPRRPRFSTRW